MGSVLEAIFSADLSTVPPEVTRRGDMFDLTWPALGFWASVEPGPRVGQYSGGDPQAVVEPAVLAAAAARGNVVVQPPAS